MEKLEKYYIRPIIMQDLPYLNTWKNDKEIFQYLGGGYKPTSIDEQRKWMDSLISSSSSMRFMIVDKQINLPIGMIGLYSINHINRNCEIGLYIGDDSYHGKGSASFSYRELENYAKDYLNLIKIKAYVVEKNTRACDFWRYMGYKTTGTLYKKRFIGGNYENVLIMKKIISEVID